MDLHIKVEKKHFYFLSLVMGIVIGILLVNAYNPGAGPGSPLAASIRGHSVDEIDWSQTIPENVLIADNKYLAVGGQSVITERDANTLVIGDVAGSDGSSKLVLRAGNNDRMTITDSGDVGIGTSPLTKFDVGGNIHADSLQLGTSRPITYVSGSNPPCPAGTAFFLRNFPEKICSGSCTSCTTNGGWTGGSQNPICSYSSAPGCSSAVCVQNTWIAAFCI